VRVHITLKEKKELLSELGKLLNNSFRKLKNGETSTFLKLKGLTSYYVKSWEKIGSHWLNLKVLSDDDEQNLMKMMEE
jgi:hypothetical protein